MKLKRLILLLCLAASLGVSAQKSVNVDNLRLTYRERLMPSSPQYPVLFYYSTRIDMPNSMTRYIYPPDFEQGLFIDGQRYTDQPVAGDYMITAYLQPIEVVKNEMMERVEEKKDKDGRPYKEYYFWVEIAYTFAASGTFSRNNNILDKTELANRRKVMVFRSPEYISRRTASNYWKDNREILIEDFTRRCTTEAVASLSNRLSRKYGFVITSTSGLIKTINEKKHPENSQLRNMSDKLKSRMQSLDGTRALAENGMSDLITYFESIPERYPDPTSKADIRLRYVAYYNLCRIYIYIDQPEKVKYYADLLEENGYDKKDGGRLIKDANNLQEKLDRSYFKRSQFDPDLYYEDNRVQEESNEEKQGGLKKEDWVF